MRITTRVSTGLFLMAGVLIAGLTYQISQVERLQRINREVTLIKMEGARVSLRLLQALDGVQEFSAKYQVLPDSAYWAQWREWERAVDDDLRLLAGVGLADPREEEVRLRIEEGWTEYRGLTSPGGREPGSTLEPDAFPRVQAMLSGLRSDVEQLIAVNEAVVSEQAISSAEATDSARIVAWLTATLALLLAALLSFLLYRSISGPLSRLTRGTREIARGRFDHRLDIEGPSELSALARDFDRMAARLDELDNLKRDFVSHVSHELKTPLAAIQETIEVLLDEIPGPLTQKQAHLLELSRSSSGRLSSMISDLLETSRLEAGAAGYRPAWQDGSELVTSVLDELALLADERGVALDFEQEADEAGLVCDRNRMREVLANLVGNALKFSPGGGAVRVVLSELDATPDSCPASRESVRSESGPFLMFSVKDEGPGVSEEDKEAIFEKFHQVGREGRLEGQGVGLGLAICWRIVEAHAGAVWVEDRACGGSVFRVLVPRVPSQWADEVETQAPPSEARPEDPEESAVGVGGGAPKIALGSLLALLLTACGGGQPEIELPPSPEPQVEPVSPAQVVEASDGASLAELQLASAWSFLAEGNYEEASLRFQRVISEEEITRLSGEAAWGMALLHLLPESTYFDPRSAEALLEQLSREFPNEAAGIQAEWVRGLLADLAAVRTMVENQDEALRQLTETVEQLKSIDLNRAPRRSQPPPGDAPSSPSPSR